MRIVLINNHQKNMSTTTARPQTNSYIKSRKHSHAPALAILATLALPLAAHADETDQVVPTVTVTGTVQGTPHPVSKNDKFTAPLLDTPKAITVIPSEIISQTAATSLTDALRTVPGITIGAGEGGNPVGDNLFIRGYNAQTDTYIDGIRDSGSQSREIFDIEQVEVVKGPNSAYGGRSSAGGGINLVSKQARADDFTNATVGLGSAKYRRATADINRLVSENTAVRLNLMAHDADVAGRDVVTGRRYGFAPTITFGLTGPDRASFSFYHLSSHEIPDTGIPFNNAFTTGANVAKNGNGTPFNVSRSTFYGLADRDFRDTESNIGTIDLSHDFGNKLVLRNVTRYGKSSNDYVWTQPDDSKGNTLLYGTVWRRANTRASETDTAANATSLTGSTMTGAIKHSFTTGLEFSREKTDRTSYVFTPGTNNPLTGTSTCPTSGAATLYNCTTLVNPNPYDPWVYTRSESPAYNHIVTKTKSAYAFDTVEFTPQWLLNLGLRWDGYESTLDVPRYTLAGVTTAATHADVNSNFVSYQGGLVYKPSTNSSVYVSYGTSSTPPGNDAGDGLDGLTVAVQNLKPQESKNYELGTKWEVLPGGRLSLSAAVFKSTMDNARTTAPDGTTQNVGTKDVKGIELGASGNITKAWAVFGGYTHLKAIVANNGFVNVGTTAAPIYAASPYNGNRFPTTPENSASLWTTYAINPDFTVGGGLNSVGKVYATVNNNKYAPGYTRFDAMASYVVNRNVTLQLNVQNLTDKFYFDRVSSPHYAGVGAGRSATLTANMKF
jgi:catecholate siderophore receptor